MKILVIISMLLFLYGKTYSQNVEQESKFKEWDLYFNGVYEIKQDDYKARAIYNQLLSYSGMNFFVYYSDSFPWGYANYGGAILLDRSALEKPIDILAFLMSHEWAHEALGHKTNLFNPSKNVWSYKKGSMNEELEADEYAGKFMAEHGYSNTPVKNFIWSLPDSSIWNTQTPKIERVRYYLMGYNSYKNDSSGNISDTEVNLNSINNSEIKKCTRLLHPHGDVHPCVHKCFDKSANQILACHPNGDVSDCLHLVRINCDSLRTK